MTQLHFWYPLIGVLLLFVVLSSATVRRAPISIAVIYLAIGWGFGLMGWIFAGKALCGWDAITTNPARSGKA